jgi:D-glycero-D-manno-heptose 1,7-bisphosphate phosphatase
MATGVEVPAAPASGGRACVFLDRDGTLIEDPGYVHELADLKFLPGVPKGLSALREAGLLLIVVTNQSGVARGFYSEAQVQRFHAHMSVQLGPGAAPDAYYYCPFHPEAVDTRYRSDSPLRKPDIGMFHCAQRDFAIAPERSYMIGDKELDIEFARRAGLRGILLGASGQPELPVAGQTRDGDYVGRPDFQTATACILALHQQRDHAYDASQRALASQRKLR